MSDYPEAWGVLIDGEIASYDDTKQEAEEYLSLRRTYDPGCDSYCEIVRLIPAPVVERMIAEAEQRGRDTLVAVLMRQRDQRDRKAKELSGAMAIANTGAILILELLIRDLSGIEPGKGGDA